MFDEEVCGVLVDVVEVLDVDVCIFELYVVEFLSDFIVDGDVEVCSVDLVEWNIVEYF